LVVPGPELPLEFERRQLGRRQVTQDGATIGLGQLGEGAGGGGHARSPSAFMAPPDVLFTSKTS
jgi:hypothetical protein